VKRTAIGLREYGDRSKPQFFGGSNNADGDFASVGDEQGVKVGH
jgi:hypothetical protein